MAKRKVDVLEDSTNGIETSTGVGVVSKVASTDNAVVRFNGITGEVQNSGVIIDDSINIHTYGPQFNTYGYDGATNNFEFVQRAAGKGFLFYVDGGTKYSMSLNSSGNLLVGTITDNGIDKLQVNGSISASNKLVYQNNIIGTFTGDEWYDTGVTADTLGYNMLDTFAITVYEDSYETGNNNFHMSYKFIVGAANQSSNSGNTFDIPVLSVVGHAHNGGDVSLRWQHVAGGVAQKIQFKVTNTSTFDDSFGKSLRIYVTKLI